MNLIVLFLVLHSFTASWYRKKVEGEERVIWKTTGLVLVKNLFLFLLFSSISLVFALGLTNVTPEIPHRWCFLCCRPFGLGLLLSISDSSVNSLNFSVIKFPFHSLPYYMFFFSLNFLIIIFARDSSRRKQLTCMHTLTRLKNHLLALET